MITGSTLRTESSPEPRIFTARYYWYKRTIEGFQKSIQYYEQAVAADSNYAPAYAGLADAYALLGSLPNDGLPPNEAMPKTKAAAFLARTYAVVINI